jgi:two-component system OmpR family sensor kinase
LVLAGVALTAVNIAVISLYYVDWRDLRREKLEEQAGILVAATSQASGPVTLTPRQARLFAEYSEAYAYRIENAEGRILSAANVGLIPAGARLPPGPGAPDFAIWRPSGEGQAMVVIHRARVDGGEIVVTFASLSDPAGLTRGVFLDEIVGHVLLPLVPFALLLTLINILTVRRQLAPLTNAAIAARRIQASGALEPVATAGLPSEVADLVDAVNSALARLGRALEAERAFTAEAAHALRTPLAVLTARLDGVGDDPTIIGLRQDVAAMTRLVNQMLSSAQADSLNVDLTRECDLAEIARDVVAAMAPLAIRAGRTVALEAPAAVSVMGDPDALAHALRNLIENALHHEPAGGEVVVAAHAPGVLAVSDRGPGFTDEQKRLAPRRFWRASQAAGLGAGLGLHIVQRIAQAHGGSLDILDREGGGATVRIRV